MDFKTLLADFKKSTTEHKTKQSATNPSDYQPSTTNSTTKIKNKNPVDTIYIICPAPHKKTTGGPEALHQLCDMINQFTILQAYMLYINPPYSFTPTSTSSKTYAHYNAPYTTNIITPEDNSLCIWPECWTKYINGFNNSNCHKAIWWLSVDNNDGFKSWDDDDILHLYQSEYAREYLLKNVKCKENVIALKEYIPMPDDSNEGKDSRSMDIVYNPKKGMHYTDQIIDHLSNQYTIQPIGHPTPLSSKEVRQFLSNSKIYIDFGPHPGMDRLPREAALCGCLVITNKEGAANYDEDVPIPSEYKLDTFNVNQACKLLKVCLEEYENRVKDFDGYRKWINEQYDEMKDYVLDFVSLLNNRFGGKDGNEDENENGRKRKSCDGIDDCQPLKK